MSNKTTGKSVYPKLVMNRKLLVRVLYNCGVSEEYDMCV